MISKIVLITTEIVISHVMKKKTMAPFNGWDSTVSRLQSYYEETVDVLPLKEASFLSLKKSQ